MTASQIASTAPKNWSIDERRTFYEGFPDPTGRNRLLKFLDWAIDKELLMDHKGVPAPNIRIGWKHDQEVALIKVGEVSNENVISVYLIYRVERFRKCLEKLKFSDESIARDQYVDELKQARILDPNFKVEGVIDGRYIPYRLGQHMLRQDSRRPLPEPLFEKLFELLNKYFC